MVMIAMITTIIMIMKMIMIIIKTLIK